MRDDNAGSNPAQGPACFAMRKHCETGPFAFVTNREEKSMKRQRPTCPDFRLHLCQRLALNAAAKREEKERKDRYIALSVLIVAAVAGLLSGIAAVIVGVYVSQGILGHISLLGMGFLILITVAAYWVFRLALKQL